MCNLLKVVLSILILSSQQRIDIVAAPASSNDLSSDGGGATHGHHHAHNPLHNVSSPEFRELARATYEKVLPCIESAWMIQEADEKTQWSFPDDAQEHYEELLQITESFRHAPVHEYAGYEGPWIENIFIAKFMNVPLHRFNGLIPLFVQWIDSQILRSHYFNDIHSALNDVLRPNVLYLAVSQGDAGLTKIGITHPNILVMSAGGFGHVVLPLIKGEIPYSPPPAQYLQDISFFGTIHQSVRPQMLSQIHEAATELGLSYKDGFSEWLYTVKLHAKESCALCVLSIYTNAAVIICWSLQLLIGRRRWSTPG